ncbi:MAG TPA: glycosyltransferase [Anaerolineae bacterium]|nr:glycosyltransferase [Anaerolineae bacterium]
MRVLYLTSRLPYPPDRGDRLRAYHIIERLSSEHEVVLVSFVARRDEGDHVSSLLPFCQDVKLVHMSPRRSAVTVAANIWRSDPFQTLYYRSRSMRHLLAQIVAEGALRGKPLDAAVAHLFRMAPYLECCPRAYRIVDLTDAISEEVSRSLPYRGFLWRSIYRLEGPRIRRYERTVAGAFDEAWLISRADRDVLATSCPRANLRVVPNGVDSSRFYPTGEPARPDSLVFVGHMGVMHNVDAALFLAREILPRVRTQVPGCTLDIVGASPSVAVQQLTACPGVAVTGYVEDLNHYLNRAVLFVAPLRFAAGVQNKVLEAMSAGRPVLTTSLVNAGLGAQAGRDLEVADGADDIAREVVALLRDRERCEAIGRAGLAFVHQAYSWDRAALRMREVEASRGVA